MFRWIDDQVHWHPWYSVAAAAFIAFILGVILAGKILL